MTKNYKLDNRAFSLTEIVFSFALLVIIWLASVDVTLISKTSGSLAKHRMQAVYVDRRAIEDLRKKPFASITGSTTTVTVDTKGTPDNSADDFTGTQIVTVTDLGYYKKVVVEIRWNETLLGRNRTMREYCGTYIANDPQIN